MNGRKSIAYGLVLVAAAALLQGCGSGAGINELDARMTEIKARPRGRIEPPPEFKPIATYPYAAHKLRAPFSRPVDEKLLEVNLTALSAFDEIGYGHRFMLEVPVQQVTREDVQFQLV